MCSIFIISQAKKNIKHFFRFLGNIYGKYRTKLPQATLWRGIFFLGGYMKKIIAFILTVATLLSVGVFTSSCGCSEDGEVSVFYYTYADTYISSVRGEMDRFLTEAGVNFNNYDAGSNQATQTEQVDTAITKGSLT